MFTLHLSYRAGQEEYICHFEWDDSRDVSRFFVADIMDLIIILKYLGISNMKQVKFNNSNINLPLQKMILQLIQALTQ